MNRDSMSTGYTREFEDESGARWEAFGAPAVVAHGRPGAVLAFRPAGGAEDDLLRSTVTFNSFDAADLAIRPMSEKELRRRLALTRMAAGGV
ncbi:MAG: hypothetical protein WD737_00305 [Gemmatimonadota bacterium]